MKSLELKIPPPIVALVIAGLMGFVATTTSPLFPRESFLLIVAAILLALAGVAVAIAGVQSFRRAQTTINPLKPETTAVLVSEGIYAATRNPMYLGFLLILSGWAVYLAAPVALAGPAAFVLYMNRFQILPEERVLFALFGSTYREYTAKVRRWI